MEKLQDAGNFPFADNDVAVESMADTKKVDYGEESWGCG